MSGDTNVDTGSTETPVVEATDQASLMKQVGDAYRGTTETPAEDAEKSSEDKGTDESKDVDGKDDKSDKDAAEDAEKSSEENADKEDKDDDAEGDESKDKDDDESSEKDEATDDEEMDEDEKAFFEEVISTKHGDASVQDLVDFYEKNEGRETALTKKEMDLGKRSKEAEDKILVAEHLGLQDRDRLLKARIDQNKPWIDKAWDAHRKGETVQGFKGDALRSKIVELEDATKKLEDQLKKNIEGYDIAKAPGYQELVKEAKFSEDNYAELYTKWSKRASQFGYTPEELANAHNLDYRLWRVLHALDIAENGLEEEKKTTEKAKRARRKTRTPKGKASGNQQKLPSKKSDLSTEQLIEKANKGDVEARGILMKRAYSKRD